MQRVVIILFFTLFTFQIQAQNISVKSFRLLENDLDARVNYPKKDQNGEKCAIIKIQTTEIGFRWDGDALGITSSEKKTGEYWLYLPRGAKRLTIAHDKLGILRNYAYPLPIEESSVYELVLVTGKVITTVKENEIESQWLIINTEPSGADVYINDQPAGKTPYQNELPIGKYTWRLQKELYLNESGIFELTTGGEKQKININLKANFGTFQISSIPENGGSVNLNGIPTGKTTPCNLETVPTGEHTVSVSLDMYETTNQRIAITPGEVKPVSFIMKPTFAGVSITTDPKADIYVNGQQKANGSWQGRLNPSVYTFEAKLDKHTTATEKQTVNIGQPLTLKLSPSPRLGMLKIISTPFYAIIKINGKSYGTTPTTIKDLLIGDYTVELSLTGYATALEKATITEGQTTTINATLANGSEINISSTPSGVDLYIDNVKIGQTPFKGNLTFGNHNLRIEKDGKKAEKTININQNRGEKSFVLSFGETITDFDGNVYNIAKIGNQIWMQQNLKTTHYRNGDAIPNVTENSTWETLTTGANCVYKNKLSNCDIYGRLYNWYALADSRNLCPKGWHVPSDAEWITPTTYLGDYIIAGSKLKEAGLIHWNSPNASATNETGFTALPGGYRDDYGTYGNIGNNGYWWSSTESGTTFAWGRYVYYDGSNTYRSEYGKTNGFSVRCLRD
jgi:uncharacterized protein (TIGR02145 family)